MPSLYLDGKHNVFPALWRPSAVILLDSRAGKRTDRTLFQSGPAAKPGGHACCLGRLSHSVVADTRPRRRAGSSRTRALTCCHAGPAVYVCVGVCEKGRGSPALRASKQACPISSFSSWFSAAMASPTATKRPTATLTAWPTRWMAARVRSDFFGLSLWLISVVI